MSESKTSSIPSSPTSSQASSTKNKKKRAASARKRRRPPVPFIVGVGASAGGLEALRALLSGLDEVSACSLVVAQHMAPNYRSMLADLLSRDTRVAVQEISDGVEPRPGTLYVTPANYDVVLKGRRLRLLDPPERIGPKPSIDKLFTSLADELGDGCGGVILSGTGSDGSQGARAIKAAGGFVVAQEPTSAKYDGMPRAAINTGVVDVVLEPEGIAARLPELVSNVEGEQGSEGLRLPEEPFQGILELLKRRTGVDFTRYKPNTLRRRVQRRMNANRIADIGEYFAFLKRGTGEVRNLFQDMLISATAFFRDREQYDALREQLRERLLRRHGKAPVRVWSAGCATGEEAYSLAIILAELMDELGRRMDVQIFATDIDENAMSIARRGVYSRAAFDDVPQALVDKYFVAQENSYQIKKHIREMVVFSRHDLTRDPPFLRMDLIGCRNVFIYFEQELQERIIKVFHYALASEGLLFLGKSESIGATKSFFRLVDGHAKLFERSDRPVDSTIAFTSPQMERSEHIEQRAIERWKRTQGAGAEVTNLIRSFAPDSIVLDADFVVRELYGNARRYLSFPEGPLSQSIDQLLIPALRSKLMTLVHRARRSGEKAVGMQFESRDEHGSYVVQPRAFPVSLQGEPRMVLSFEAFEAPVRGGDEQDGPINSREIEELERELSATREHLQSVIEEQETSNEELQALNEELNSANEELQSTNEELETSNEELQSTNEELTTLNEELNIKSAELLDTNSHLAAVQNAIRDPLLMVNRDLEVVGYNEAAAKSLRVEQGHLNRNVRLIPREGPLEAGFDLIERCLREGRSQLIQTCSGDSDFEVRCDPIFNHHGEVDGAVTSFVDNTPMSQTLRRVQASEGRLAALFENIPAMVTIKDTAGRYTYGNARFCALLGIRATEVEGKRDADLFPKALASRFRASDRDVIATLESRRGEETIEGADGQRVFLSSRFPLFSEEGTAEAVCCVSFDVTESVAARRRLELFADVISASSQVIVIFDRLPREDGTADYRATFVSDSVGRILEVDPNSLQGRSLDEVWAQCFAGAPDHARQQLAALRRGREELAEVKLRANDGRQRWFDARATYYSPLASDPARQMCLVVSDITLRKESEQMLRQKQEEVLKAAKLAALGEMAAGIAHELNTPLNTIQGYIDLVRRARDGGSYDAGTVGTALDAIEDTVGQTSEIVSGLRSIARLDQGGERRDCELLGMLNEIIRVCDLQLRNKGIQIELHSPVEELHFRCLPTQVSQVFVNLLNNAIDAVRVLEEKWIRVEVIDEGENVRVRVIDSGEGIPPKIAAMVMTPFFTTKDEGTGLGLSLSRSLLQAHGGDLRIDVSCANTCFEVMLPKRGTNG